MRTHESVLVDIVIAYPYLRKSTQNSNWATLPIALLQLHISVTTIVTDAADIRS